MQNIMSYYQNLQDFVSNNQFLQIEILSNKVYELLLGFLIFLGAIVVLKIFEVAIVVELQNVAKKTKTQLDDMLVEAIRKVHWPFYVFTSLYIALQLINTHQMVLTVSYYVFLIAVIFYAIRFAENLIDYIIVKILERQAGDEGNFAIVKLIGSVIKLGLWAGAVVLILANMGYNVTSLIAGLGVGGIAVALALKNVLEDLISSLAIYLDKPFKVGDYIAVGDKKGIVKKVGIKTTRIVVPQGEELVISNSDINRSQIRNFGIMERWRAQFPIKISYDTPIKQLRAIPDMVIKIIEKHKEADVQRVYFTSFAESSLSFEIAYYVNSPVYKDFLEVQQQVNLEILEKFEKEKIKIAYPTQTVHVKK